MADQNQNLAELARKKRHLHLIEKIQAGKALTKQEILELEQFESEPLPATIVKTVEEVAKVMGVTYRTVQRWKLDGMPSTKEGFYDLEEIKSWHIQRGQRFKEQDGRAYWDEKISEYKAELLRLEVKKATSEVILYREHVEIIREQVRGIKMGFLRLPHYIAPKLYQQEPKVICEILDNEIRAIINQFAGAYNADKTDKGKSKDH